LIHINALGDRQFRLMPVKDFQLRQTSASGVRRYIKHHPFEENAMNRKFLGLFLIAAIPAALLTSPVAHAVDVDAAKQLAKQNNCFKCHSVEKEKDGPSYKKVAEKYKGKPEAEAKLINHVTSGEKAKFPDGHEEEHKIIKTDPPKDMAQIKNLVQWILAQ
jgi:cytochrome c